MRRGWAYVDCGPRAQTLSSGLGWYRSRPFKNLGILVELERTDTTLSVPQRFHEDRISVNLVQGESGRALCIVFLKVQLNVYAIGPFSYS